MIDLDAVVDIARRERGAMSVKGPNRVMSCFERVAQRCWNPRKRRSDFILRHPHRRDVDAVEALRELPDGGVATPPDLGNDGANVRYGTFSTQIRTRQIERIARSSP